jgi:hypothetical protein
MAGSTLHMDVCLALAGVSFTVSCDAGGLLCGLNLAELCLSTPSNVLLPSVLEVLIAAQQLFVLLLA